MRGTTSIAMTLALYANHYFLASVGLSVALDDATLPWLGMDLVYLNRSRIDLLGGIWGGLRRLFLMRRLEDGMRKNLGEVARRLESLCPAPAPESQP